MKAEILEQEIARIKKMSNRELGYYGHHLRQIMDIVRSEVDERLLNSVPELDPNKIEGASPILKAILLTKIED